MPNFNIGFGGGGRDSGAFGSLGRSVAAAMAPQAEGFGGKVGAFLNPGPTLARQERAGILAELRPLYEQSNSLLGKAMRMAHLGDQAGALEAANAAGQVLVQGGIDPGDSGVKMVEAFTNIFKQGKIGEAMAGGGTPEQITRGILPLSENVEQATQGAARLQDILTSGAQQKGLEQRTTQEAGLYPGKVRGQELENLGRVSGLATDVAQRGQIGAQTGLIGVQTQGALTENQQKALELEQFSKTGMRPATAVDPRALAARGSELIDDEARYKDSTTKLVTELFKGKPDVGGMRTPYSPEEANEMVSASNNFADMLEQRTGRKQPRVVIQQGQPRLITPDPDKPDVTQTLPGGAVPRVGYGRQEQGGAVQPTGPGGQVPLPAPGQAPGVLGMEHPDRSGFDRIIPAAKQAVVKKLKAEAQRAIGAAPPEKKSEIMKWFEQQIAREIEEGQAQ